MATGRYFKISGKNLFYGKDYDQGSMSILVMWFLSHGNANNTLCMSIAY